MANLKLSNVNKIFGKTQTIFDVDLDIKDGEFVVFVGPSGCGKSTLLRLIAGLETISSGNIEIGGRNVNKLDPSQRGIAMVFQSYALYPHMSVLENMSIGLKVSGMDKEIANQKARDVAKILQLEHLLDRKPAQLSGGQRQRVAIGRAIVRNPDVFLFDEPLSNLDAELRVQMRLEIANLHESLKSTMIYVTHDQTEAMTLADKIVVLRAGKIEQVGSPMELYNYPVNQFVAGFIGSPKMNFIPVKLVKQEGRNIFLSGLENEPIKLILKDDAPLVDLPMSLGIRPEHIYLGNQRDITINMEVVAVEQLGNTSYIHTKQGETKPLVIEINGEHNLHRHDKVQFSFDVEQCYLFDHTGLTIPLANC